MAVSQIIKTKRDGTITIKDATAITPLEVEVQFENGDLTIDIPGPTVNAFLDRGEFGDTPSLRFGDDQAITWSFSANLRNLTEAAAAVLMDIVAHGGTFESDWVSTIGANAEVKTCLLEFLIEGVDHGDGYDHLIALNHSWITGSIAEGDPDTISLSGTSYIVYPSISTVAP
jgi:hypothetical protein